MRLKRRIAKPEAAERRRARSANVGPSGWGPKSRRLEFTGEKPLEPEPCSLCGKIPEVSRVRWGPATEI